MKERVKLVRAKSKLTQTQFATHLGVTRDIIASWENGRVEPPEALVRVLCREFGVSYKWLKQGETPMDVPASALAIEKFDAIMNGDNEFLKAVLCTLIDLPVETWQKVASFVDVLQAMSHNKS